MMALQNKRYKNIQFTCKNDSKFDFNLVYFFITLKIKFLVFQKNHIKNKYDKDL